MILKIFISLMLIALASAVSHEEAWNNYMVNAHSNLYVIKIFKSPSLIYFINVLRLCKLIYSLDIQRRSRQPKKLNSAKPTSLLLTTSLKRTTANLVLPSNWLTISSHSWYATSEGFHLSNLINTVLHMHFY
jgi:hypothetical protein